MIEMPGSGAYYLKYNRYGSLFAVKIRNSQRYPFPVFSGPQNNKLPRLGFGRLQGSGYFHQGYCRVKASFFYNLYHVANLSDE
jgi:hypothetical protein